MSATSRSNLRTERGGAYIELLLAFPILCTCIFAGLEYSRALNQLQVAVSSSREIANVAFRNCIADAVQARRSAQAAEFDQTTCLSAARTELVNAQQINAIFPGLEFRLAAYSYDPAANAISADGSASYGSACVGNSADCNSRYSVAAFTDNPLLKDAAQQYGTLVVAEVFIPYNGLLSGATSMFHFTPKVIYGTTIL